MSQTDPHQLGAFDLHYLIGEGGMGEVWLGTHRDLKTSVAVKILREDRIQDPRMRENFLREAESVARLLHPGIVRVFDYGEISDDLARSSQGLFAATAPYMAMELANRGSLSQLRGVMTWRQLKWLLIEILNALAHAHARDLIHRDLKPENILLDAAPDGRTLVKLTDFGIVHQSEPDRPLDTQNMNALYAGTPAYMSPEQIRGRWRDFGPWTDLYAVGCVAYELCQGELPFKGNNLFDIAHQQLTQAIPPIKPRMPVPRGFESFILTLMQKDSAQRYQRAVDAAWALEQLPDIALADSSPEPIALLHSSSERGSIERVATLITLELSPTHASRDTLNTDLLAQLPALCAEAPRSGSARMRRGQLPPLPTSWHTLIHERVAEIDIRGAGLGLHALREVPLIGREEDRDEIWRLMLHCYKASTPGAVLLDGPQGIGKTKLAMWLGARAHELGAANILRASHALQSTTRQGFVRMFARFLRTSNLSREKTERRVRDWLTCHSRLGISDEERTRHVEAITELLAPAQARATPEEAAKRPLEEEPLRFNTPRERYGVISILLEHLCSYRPVLLIVDDVHRSLESLELMRFVLTEPSTMDLPIFAIMTSAQPHVEEIRPASRRVMQEIAELSLARLLTLGHLDKKAQHTLIDAILPLDDPLPDEIITLSHGHPMFAMQLIGQWIERDMLELHDSGAYRLKEGADEFLSQTLDQIWNQRIANLLHRIEHLSPRFSKEDIRVAIEIAAALGKEVSFCEWGLACSLHGKSIPASLVREMTSQGFAIIDELHWMFCHDMLRLQLLLDADDGDRLEAINMSCARMIDQLYERDQEGAPERLVEHLLKSTDPALATAPLLYLGRRALQTNDYDLCAQRLLSLQEILPKDKPSRERDEYTFLKLRWLMVRFGVPRAKVWRELLRHDRLVHQTPELDLIGIALDALEAKIPASHLVLCAQLAERCADAGNHSGAVHATLLRAKLELLRGNARPCRKHARVALELGQAERDDAIAIDHLEAQAFLMLGSAYRLDGHYDKATRALKRAESSCKKSQDRHGLALVWLDFGHMARTQSNPAAAQKFYRDAHQQLLELAHPEAAIARTFLASEALYGGRAQEAIALCGDAIEALTPSKLHLPLALAHLVRAASHADLADLDAWLGDHQRAETLLGAQDVASLEVAQLAEHAALTLSQMNSPLAIQAIMLATTHSIRCDRSIEALDRLHALTSG